MKVRNRDRDATPFVTKDGSTIREYHHTALQSLAEASLEPGAATQRHYHAGSEEIYLILDGGGELEVDGEAARSLPATPCSFRPRPGTSSERDRVACDSSVAACSPYADDDTFFA